MIIYRPMVVIDDHATARNAKTIRSAVAPDLKNPELAARMGLSTRQLIRLEAGERHWNTDLAEIYLDALLGKGGDWRMTAKSETVRSALARQGSVVRDYGGEVEVRKRKDARIEKGKRD